MKPPSREQSPQLSADERRVLEERAQALARPLEETAAAAPTLELLTFSVAGSAYAVTALDAIAVVPLDEPTPVPGTSPAVRGVINHRGRILAVIDVGRLLEATEHAGPETRLGLVVATDETSFVLLTETVPELVSLEEAEVTPPDRPEVRPDGVVRAVTGTMAAVLDVAALAHDPRITVDHEAE